MSKCNTCLKAVKTTRLRKHMILHHSGKTQLKEKVTCPLCYQQFSQKTSLGGHLKEEHLDDLCHLDESRSPLFSIADCEIECEDCDAKLISESSFRVHKNKFHVKCDQCRKSFPPRIFNLHMARCQRSQGNQTKN